MDENVKKNYEYWCTSPIFDDATKSELKSVSYTHLTLPTNSLV